MRLGRMILRNVKLIVQADVLLDAFFTSLDKTIGLKNGMVAMTGDHGVATSQKAGDAMGMLVLDFLQSS